MLIAELIHQVSGASASPAHVHAVTQTPWTTGRELSHMVCTAWFFAQAGPTATQTSVDFLYLMASQVISMSDRRTLGVPQSVEFIPVCVLQC